MIDQPTKLGISFHRTFPLRRSGVGQVLDVIIKATHSAESMSYEKIWQLTSLGKVDAQACSRYCVGLGLISVAYGTTDFGHLAGKHDPTLSLTSTQWLMHYFMTSPCHAGPTYWMQLVTAMRPSALISREALTAELAECLRQDETRPSAATIRRAVTAFTGSYSKEEGFNAIRLLDGAGQENQLYDYSVQDVQSPPYEVIAFAVCDYWDGAFGARQSVNLDSLTGESGLAGLLMMHSGDMIAALKEMQTRGLIELQRRIPPYQVYRLWNSTSEILNQVYHS